MTYQEKCPRYFKQQSVKSHHEIFVPEKTTFKKNTPGYSNTIGFKLKAEMTKTGISAAELARRSGVLTSFIYDILNGKSSNPSIIKLAHVAEALGVSLHYLVHGELEKNPTNNRRSDIDRNEAIYISIPHIKLSSSTNTKKGIVSFKEEDDPYRFNARWLFDRFDGRTTSLRILTINGDSMEPAICHNDIVMIDMSQKTPSPPGIFVIFDGFGLSAKRLEYVFENEPEHIRIISDNQYYSTYERLASDMLVVGRVVWFSRSI